MRTALSQQRMGMLVERNSYDPPDEVRDIEPWESFANIPVVPRRTPWRVSGANKDYPGTPVEEASTAFSQNNIGVLYSTNSAAYSGTSGPSLPSGTADGQVLRWNGSQWIADYVRLV